MLSLNIFILLFVNPLSAKLLFSPDGDLNRNTQIILLAICFTSLLIIYLLKLAINQLNNGHNKLPTFLSNISLCILVIAGLIFAGEISVRLFLSNLLLQDLYGYNEVFKMNYMKPNLKVKLVTSEYDVLFETNSLGLRGTGEFHARKHNEKRIVALGDSFIQAANSNIQNTMSHLLEQTLNIQSSNLNFKVINTARSGWSASHEREFIEKNWEFLDPDAVLLFIYVGNDILETMLKDRNNKTASNSISIISAINRKSKLFRLLSERIDNINKWPMGRPNQPFYDPYFPNGEGNIFKISYDSQIEQAFDVVKNEILKIRDVCKKNNIAFYLYIIPTKEQVDNHKFQEVVQFLKLDVNQVDLNKPQRILFEFAEQNNIRAFDLLPALKKGAAVKSVYFDINSHWNDYGNFIVAKEVYNNLIEYQY